jgi:hypothetical protein
MRGRGMTVCGGNPDAVTRSRADPVIAELFSGRCSEVFDARHEAAVVPSSLATSAARIVAPISVNNRCASKSSRWRAASSPASRASSARSRYTWGSNPRAPVSLTRARARSRGFDRGSRDQALGAPADARQRAVPESPASASGVAAPARAPPPQCGIVYDPDITIEAGRSI